MERTNARHLAPRSFRIAPELATIDVSFISLAKVLRPVADCLAPGGEILALVKPQFELEPERVGKGGVVRDPADRRDAVVAVGEGARDGAGGAGVRAVRAAGAEGQPRDLRPSVRATARDRRPRGAAAEGWTCDRRDPGSRGDPHRGPVHPLGPARDRCRRRRRPSRRERPPFALVAAPTSSRSTARRRTGCSASTSCPKRPELCLVLGGDGTILKALRAYAGTEVPVFGINFGTVGFLAAAEGTGSWKQGSSARSEASTR